MGNKEPAARISAQEELRSALGKQIADLEERLRQLKYKRNSLAYISQLPGEPLCNIFTEYKILSVKEQSSQPFASPFGWMTVGQICHRWRELSLELKRFWSHIKIGTEPEMSPRFIQLMLARSNPPTLLRVGQIGWHHKVPGFGRRGLTSEANPKNGFERVCTGPAVLGAQTPSFSTLPRDPRRSLYL